MGLFRVVGMGQNRPVENSLSLMEVKLLQNLRQAHDIPVEKVMWPYKPISIRFDKILHGF